ncbi:uncharacterized protein L3040_001740 [Drepanopeziza brunnea f. sp. 'multigermtubi']|uniref:Integral membrane protein n=1 Tax=Marssonina brunnea f. sp. multigermtubi (strain MB_m1) TaxID=1072389 RepID=K1X3R8_MARBU|nr:uncharacterized protein MBM_06589 [Drepanopeziza brunnea f. sp. 'multigermtubi' MB_m1]EKD15373.1 integral membrane protein [Drepanopeziza brunnea f. sp. 'multigermtubi' MB_m1]KAJ5051979.1 hypothetical protein L3040_001740 [Drepanopeziza brunnea f. sp. 'multigermtubi']
MQMPPASVIASWPAPNYVDPDTRGNANVILNIAFYVILICFVVLRVFTRTHLNNAFGADDVLILCAMVPTTGFFIISVLKDTKYLWIRHTYDIPPSYVVGGLKMVMAAQVAFGAAITLTKLSMLMLVKKLLTSTSTFWRRITIIAIIFVALQGTVFGLTIIFQCRPMQDYWKITEGPQPNCIDQAATLLAAGIINTLTDILTVLLPIRTVSTLQLPRRQMIIVIVLFGLGFISCIAGIVRTYYMWEVTVGWDQTWRSYPVWKTSAIELYLAIICASIPATRPFFSAYLPHLFGTMNSNYFASDHSQNMQTRSHRLDSHGEEMVDLDQKLGAASSRGMNSISISGSDSRGHSNLEDSACIHVQHKVTMSMEYISKPRTEG